MSTRSKNIPALALACALTLTVLVSPVATAVAGPTSAGIVLWYDDAFSFGYPDYEGGLAAWFGIDIVAACSGGDPNISTIHFQDITIPGADQRIITVANSDALPVTVWRVEDLDDGGCPIGMAAPVATGQVRLRYTDNDTLAFVGNNPNANAWGFTAHGALTRSDGQTVHFSSTLRQVWDGADGLKINHTVISIRLH